MRDPNSPVATATKRVKISVVNVRPNGLPAGRSGAIHGPEAEADAVKDSTPPRPGRVALQWELEKAQAGMGPKDERGG